MIAGFFPATTMPDDEWWQVLWPNPVKVLGLMGVRPGMVAVDLCCGDGLFTVALAGIANRVHAIDIDPAMLDRAAARVAAAGRTNCAFVVADAMTVAECVLEPVDYVFLANTFHGVPNRLLLAHAVAATLKPGGQFGIVNWHPWPREATTVLGAPRGPKTEMRLAAREVTEIVEAAGLVRHRAIALPPYHYGIVFCRMYE
jgi:SAM-dependent methyltransferase